MPTDERIKNLISSCEDELSFKPAGGIAVKFIRRPNCPLINVIWDGRTHTAMDTVERTFDSIWRCGFHKEETVAFVEGATDAEELEKRIRQALIPMKNSQSMPIQNTSHIAHYLDMFSDDFDTQLSSAISLATNYNPALFATAYTFLFIICNDFNFSLTEEIQKKIKEIDKRIKPINNIFAFYLGSQFADGSSLGKNGENENYRISSLIAILASTYPDDSNHVPQNFVPSLVNANSKSFTAAYFDMHKPVQTISRVTLKQIVDGRIKKAEDNRKELFEGQAAESSTQFFSYAGLNDSKIPSLEDAYEKCIRQYLPAKEAFRFLPKWKKARKTENYKLANEMTEGFLNAFVKKYYINCANNLSDIILEKICDSFIASLSENFDYDFARKYFEKCAAYLDNILPVMEQGIFSGAESFAKKSFYETIKPKLKDAMIKYANECEKVANSLTHISNSLSSPPLASVSGVEPEDSFYINKTDEFLIGSGQKILNRIAPNSKNEELFDSIFECFKDIVAKDPELYNASLEDELSSRIITGTMGQIGISTTEIIFKELNNSAIVNKGRVRATGIKTIDSYYIYYGAAAFEGALDSESKRFVTCCADNAEKLIIQSFDTNNLM